MSEQTAGKKMIPCPSCGASMDAALSSCPFCGHVNETADEAAFYKDLDQSRREVREMVDIPEETATKEVRHAGRLIITVLAAAAILILLFIVLQRTMGGSSSTRDTEADYLWMQSELPKFQAAYDAGMASADAPADRDFSELIALYKQGSKENAPVWNFEHDAFVNLLDTIDRVEQDPVYTGSAETDNADRTLTRLQLLFYDEMSLALVPDHPTLSDEEKAVLIAKSEGPVRDLTERFSLTDAELEQFKSEYRSKRYLSYQNCEDFVRARMK